MRGEERRGQISLFSGSPLLLRTTNPVNHLSVIPLARDAASVVSTGNLKDDLLDFISGVSENSFENINIQISVATLSHYMTQDHCSLEQGRLMQTTSHSVIQVRLIDPRFGRFGSGNRQNPVVWMSLICPSHTIES